MHVDDPALTTALRIVAANDPHMGPYSTAKTTTFYRLAQQSPGPIVELGTHIGLGTVALCYGAGVQEVYTVDAFAPHTNWIGTAEPADKYPARFLKLCLEADIEPTLIRGDILQVAAEWSAGPIGLLLWDLGRKDRLPADLRPWLRHVMPGGRIAVRDIDNRDLGSGAAMAELEELGWDNVQEWPKYIWSADRPAEVPV